MYQIGKETMRICKEAFTYRKGKTALKMIYVKNSLHISPDHSYRKHFKSGKLVHRFGLTANYAKGLVHFSENPSFVYQKFLSGA